MSPFDPRRPPPVNPAPWWFGPLLALGALGSLAIVAGILIGAVAAIGRL